MHHSKGHAPCEFPPLAELAMPKTITDLDPRDCRFIQRDGLYCASETAAPTVSYCDHHLSLCYNVRPGGNRFRRDTLSLPIDRMPEKAELLTSTGQERDEEPDEPTTIDMMK